MDGFSIMTKSCTTLQHAPKLRPQTFQSKIQLESIHNDGQPTTGSRARWLSLFIDLRRVSRWDVDHEYFCDLLHLLFRETIIKHLHELVKGFVRELVLVREAEFLHQEILHGHHSRGDDSQLLFTSLVLHLGLAEEMVVARRHRQGGMVEMINGASEVVIASTKEKGLEGMAPGTCPLCVTHDLCS
jgi:hypothetical protein